MSNFTVEISVESDGKIISLDASNMEIYIYQNTGDGPMRAFEITCNAPRGKVIGTLLTEVKHVGDEDNDLSGLLPLETDSGPGTMKTYSNKHGG